MLKLILIIIQFSIKITVAYIQSYSSNVLKKIPTKH